MLTGLLTGFRIAFHKGHIKVVRQTEPVVRFIHIAGDLAEQPYHIALVGRVQGEVVFFVRIFNDIIQLEVDFILKGVDDEFLVPVDDASLVIAIGTIAVILDEDPVTAGLLAPDQGHERDAVGGGMVVDAKEILQGGPDIDQADQGIGFTDSRIEVFREI